MSDDDSSDEEDSCMIDWAKIPFTNRIAYSDWQIDVKIMKSNHDDDDDDDDVDEASYLVHRYRIGSKSTYFKAIFNDANAFFSESHQKRSLVVFPANAPVTLHDFEILLNYFYIEENEREIAYELWSHSEAVALLYFADYFGIKKLRKQAVDFIEGDIQMVLERNVCMQQFDFVDILPSLFHVYALGEGIVSMESLRDDIARKCYTNYVFFSFFWQMHLRACDLRNKLLHHLCRLRKTKSLEEKETPGDCERWHSNVVDKILLQKHNKVIINRDIFSKLTEKETMGDLNYEGSDRIAIWYLQQEQRLGLDERSIGLTRLQQRCVKSLCDEENREWKIDPKDALKRATQLQRLRTPILRALLWKIDPNDENLIVYEELEPAELVDLLQKSIQKNNPKTRKTRKRKKETPRQGKQKKSRPSAP